MVSDPHIMFMVITEVNNSGMGMVDQCTVGAPGRTA